jgi:hypothetical protein
MNALTRTLSSLLVLASFLGAAAEHAQAAAPQKRSRAASRADKAKATRLVEEAVDLFRAGKFLAAAELFLEAHELSNLPAPLRNGAKAFEKGGDAARALEAWRRYRSLEGLAPAERAEADAEITRFEERERADRAVHEAEAARRAAEIEAERARREKPTSTATKSQVAGDEERTNPPAAVAEPGSSARTPPAPSSDPRIEAAPPVKTGPPLAAWATLGTGSAALAASLGVFLHAASRTSDLDSKLATTDADHHITGIAQSDATTELGAINRERRFSALALGLGAALAAVGAAWLILTWE